MEDRAEEITATEQKKENRMKRNEDSLRDLWDNIKGSNICIIGVPEGEEREEGAENIFENIIAENSPNLGREINIRSRKHRKSPKQVQSKEDHTKTHCN